MDRLMACLLAAVLAACSDDGTASGASAGGTGSAGTGDSGNGGTTQLEPSTSAGESAGSASGGATTSAGTSGTACQSDDDCRVVNDCCSCAAIHVDDTPAPCGLPNCEAATCTAMGLPDLDARCRFGTCEFVPLVCNPVLVACDETAPECPEGRLPSVVESCWGPCVGSELCDVVGSCDDCPDDEACVETSAQLGISFTCEPIDPSCAGTPDCTCMGAACEDPFECVPAGDANGAELACTCPAC